MSIKKPVNKIEKLIDELCPDGVEFRALGEIMTIMRGASPRPIHSFLTDDAQGINWIKIGDVDPTAKYVTKTMQKITQKGAEKSRFLKKGNFILSNSMSFGRPYILEIEGCIHDGWIAMSDFEKTVISDFLYHLLRSDIVQKYWQQKASSGTVQNLNADIVRNTIIPIPPLTIQKEIVKILDNFIQLEAELDARKKQYEHYREALLSFDDGVAFRELREACLSISAGGDLPKKYKKGQTIPSDEYPYPIYANATDMKGLYGYTNNYKIESNAVTISARGAKIGYHTMREAKFTPIIRLITLIPNKEIITTKFLNYILDITSIVGTKGGIPQLTVPNVKKIKIPIPPLSEQKRIVAILDKFDALVNDISVGLPAEISARKKQYEYYRNQLLTFKPLGDK